MLTLTYFAWGFFWPSFQSGETSSNTGGLILWPVKSLMPLGFALVLLQGVSELIKRIAGLRGLVRRAGRIREAVAVTGPGAR